MRVLIAPDKFKGSLSSLAAAEAIARGWVQAWPECTTELAPIADGGEGFAAALQHTLGGEWIEVPAVDALGRPINARYAWFPAQRRAVIEMSEASGLWRLTESERDALRANTYGTGILLRHAIALGADEVLLGLGGSATTDGGVGLARALGFGFLGRDGQSLEGAPSEFTSLTRIARDQVAPMPRIVAACDVENPLLGARGTAAVFSPQKGASPEQVPILENGLKHLADIVQCDLGCDFRETPGAGAAGGLGFGLLSFAGAHIRSGFDIVSEALELSRRIGQADLVLTGEGRLDKQTLEGKGPAGVASLARAASVPVLAFGGSIQDEAEVARSFDAICPIVCAPLALSEAMARGEELLEQAAGRAARLLRLGTLRLATTLHRVKG